MGKDLVNVIKRGGISFLDFLLRNSLILIDDLGAGEVETGDDGDKDILWIVFLEIGVSEAF